VQALVYRRGLRTWPAEPPAAGGRQPRSVVPVPPSRFDPRAIAAAAAVAFALLLASTEWLLLAGVAAWQAAAWAVTPRERDVLRTGAVLGAALAGGALVFGLVGGLGADVALRRAARAALLVAVATWLRSAAGEAGLREVFRRMLSRLRRVGVAREAAPLLDELDSGRQLAPAGRALLDALRDVRRRPVPIADAVLGWVVREAAGFSGSRVPSTVALAVRWRDGALVLVAAAPVALLVGS
jgi:hypothetical protein